MKKNCVGVLSLLLMTFGISCGPSQKEKEEALRSEVMAIHDEVMPRTEELFRFRKRLQGMVDSLLVHDMTDTLLRFKAQQLIMRLREADDSMRHWMHNYNGGAGLYEHTEVMQYLQAEKEKILGVQKAITEAIDSAHAFLEKKP